MNLHKPAVLICLLLAACRATTADADRPARIVAPDDSSREELRQAINEILDAEVLLSDDAFVNSSFLVIENWPPGTMANPVPQGREPGRPMTFQLVKNGDECILVRQVDGQRLKLARTQCKPE